MVQVCFKEKGFKDFMSGVGEGGVKWVGMSVFGWFWVVLGVPGWFWVVLARLGDDRPRPPGGVGEGLTT